MSSKKTVLGRWVDNHTILLYVEGNHLMTQALDEISNIIATEDKKHKRRETPFQKGVRVLNLDEYEKLRAIANQCNQGSTVDMVVGLHNNQLLLVEIKLNKESGKNNKSEKLISEVNRKVRYSREILNTKEDFQICTQYIVILTNDLFAQNYNRLKRLNANTPNCMPQTVQMFYDTFFK